MFSFKAPDPKPRPQTPKRSPRFAAKSKETPTTSIFERPSTALDRSYGGDNLKNRLPSNTLKGMKVLWRQSQMAQSLRRTNRDGQMPVEEISDTSDSSDNSSPNLVMKTHNLSKPKKRQQKDGGGKVINKVTGKEVPKEVKVVEAKKEVAEVAVQAMRPASISALLEGRLNMLESRLRLEEMRSKSWCVRMTDAEDSLKQLQGQVKALTAGVNGSATPSRFMAIPSRERGLWPANMAEIRKSQKLVGKTSQVFGKDFTTEFHAILQQIRKDNESEEMAGDFCADKTI